jgi:flagellar protein FlgJ
MTPPIRPVSGAPVATAAATTRPPDDARLRRAAEQFEGMFVRQMFAAMRATVPNDGVVSGGQGEELFTSLMDEHIADSAPARGHRGFAAQIVESMRPQAAAPQEKTP